MSPERTNPERLDDDFTKWLAEAHPDFKLTPAQEKIIAAALSGQRVVLARVPRHQGRTFAFDLWREYQEHLDV